LHKFNINNIKLSYCIFRKLFDYNIPDEIQEYIVKTKTSLIKFVKNQNPEIIKNIIKKHMKNIYFVNNMTEDIFKYA
jgi:hypothetical protein